MACGSCGLQLSFGKKRRSRRGSRRGSRRRSIRKSRRSHRRRYRKSKGSKGSKRSKRSKVRKGRRFGIVAGPGFEGQTSYTNAYAPYFGSAEPFVNASNWWYPYTGGVAQSPQMLMKSAGRMNGPGN